MQVQDDLHEELAAAQQWEIELHDLHDELRNTPLWGHLRKKLGEQARRACTAAGVVFS